MGQLFIVCRILLFSGLKIGELLCARHNCSICICFQYTIMALQAKRPHIAPQTQHGKRFGIFYELFFRDILLQGRRQLTWAQRNFSIEFIRFFFHCISREALQELVLLGKQAFPFEFHRLYGGRTSIPR